MVQGDSKYTYKYFTLGSDNPVRVVFNDAGQKIGAEIPDPQTGDFEKDATFLSRLETSPDAQEIDQKKFKELCVGIYSKKWP